MSVPKQLGARNGCRVLPRWGRAAAFLAHLDAAAPAEAAASRGRAHGAQQASRQGSQQAAVLARGQGLAAASALRRLWGGRGASCCECGATWQRLAQAPVAAHGQACAQCGRQLSCGRGNNGTTMAPVFPLPHAEGPGLAHLQRPHLPRSCHPGAAGPLTPARSCQRGPGSGAAPWCPGPAAPPPRTALRSMHAPA